MKRIAVTQRVDTSNPHNERRDALDQRWNDFLQHCDLIPVLVPNHPHTLRQLMKQTSPSGILLTGGNSLQKYGGTAPERDETENLLLQYSIDNKLPAIGVCRGMQVIQNFFGVPLVKVGGHVTPNQVIVMETREYTVNSYHDYGAFDTTDELSVVAKAQDDVIEAIRHRSLPMHGIMWHPERCDPFRKEDIQLFRKIFST